MNTVETMRTILFGMVIFIALFTGCNNISTQVKGDDDKMNGGFEIVKDKLPVNWWFTPKDLPTEDFNIIMDTTEYKEGKQSLKIINRFFSASDSVFSPGFFQQFNAVGGETYNISFWLMNDGSSLKISTETNAYMKPRMGENDTTIIIDFDIHEWTYYEYSFTVPPKLDFIYFAVNIYKPGTVWFDDIQIVGTENDNSERTIMSK